MNNNPIVIVGPNFQIALEELQRLCHENGNARIKRSSFTAEATIEDQLYIAMGGKSEDVCWLRDLGFHIKEIRTIQVQFISEQMAKRINHIRSTIRRKTLGE